MFSGYKKRDIPQPEPIQVYNKEKNHDIYASGGIADAYMKTINQRIIILWATIRPNVFKSTHANWMANAKLKSRISTMVAVDNAQQASELTDFNVIVTNTIKPGVCFPGYCLSSRVVANPQDIIIFASDDFFPPVGWDMFLYKQLESETNKLLIVNDGIQGVGSRMVTIPIMTYGALCAMNHVVYHPTYNHLQSDVELFDVSERLGLIKDIRSSESTIFEHRHYSNAKRAVDENDMKVNVIASNDAQTYINRKTKSIDELIFVDNETKIAAQSAISIDGSTRQKLSILICTTPKRERLLTRLLNTLAPQITEDTEIVIESDSGEMTIGHKRNILLDKAIHDYVCFVDDDDLVSTDYVTKIVNAIQSKPDCCSLLGVFTTNGVNPIEFHHSLQYTHWSNDRIPYERNPNHLNAIKRELALQVKFNDDMSIGEDKDFSTRILPLLKTEVKIEGVIYHYLWLTSKDMHDRDTNKKVIAFSLWGSNPFYTEGVIKNCAMASEYYPGWVVWVYINDTVPESIIDRILAYGAIVINVGGTDTSAWGMMWRFLPTGDPTVAAFMSRDGDSRFSKRETKLVTEWMESDKDFHIIRDHEQHGLPVCGGMWGVKRGALATRIFNEMNTFRDRYGQLMNARYAHNNMKNTDQDFLAELIYPHTEGNRIAHVSAGLIVDGDIIIPPAADGEFIGKPVEWNQ